MLSKENRIMDSAHKRRHKRNKKERSHQSFKHLLEKRKLLEKKAAELAQPQPSSSQDQASLNEEEAKVLSKKVSASVQKKALDKKGKRVKMSSKENKSREEVVAAREAKKLAKQKAKKKEPGLPIDMVKERKKSQSEATEQKSKDEVDKAAAAPVDKGIETVVVKAGPAEKGNEKLEADGAQKKGEAGDTSTSPFVSNDMTVGDVSVALSNIQEVAVGFMQLKEKVKAMHLEGRDSNEKQPPCSKPESEKTKTKAELKAERRAKQEAQRAAKQAATVPVKPQEPSAKPKEVLKTTDAKTTGKAESPKPKTPKKEIQQNQHQLSWFGQVYNDNAQALKNMPVNTHIHPAFIKLGIQLVTKRVSGSNARCVALLDALKKMTKDFVLPAKTEFGRGLDALLTETLDFLATMRQRTASEINAVKFYRHHLMQLPNNVNEYEAKKTLQDEIDRYIREQVIVAGEAISAAVRTKISPGDIILTYGFSSLVERCLVDAHSAGIRFRVMVCGCRGAESERGARELKRRLCARGLLVDVIDITALGVFMRDVSKVVMGASEVLSNGCVLGAVGTALVARQARLRNVPVLIACETHKFSGRVQTDAFGHNELGDPDNLNPDGNDDWPLKDWRNKPFAILNLVYDLTPACLVTAVVTELAILPCTSAPVVLRFRRTAYGF